VGNPAFKFDHIHIIALDPSTSANWYVQMFGAVIVADTIARGAAQIFVSLGGATILIRGSRPGEAPTGYPPIQSNPSVIIPATTNGAQIILVLCTLATCESFAKALKQKMSNSLYH
jgi:hypothetical protein